MDDGAHGWGLFGLSACVWVCVCVCLCVRVQLPDDVLPKWNAPPRAPKLHHRLPKVPVPPREERVFKAKYVFKDINESSGDAAHLRVVDYDGTVRPSTTEEAASRTWRMQRWNIRPNPADDPLDFNPVSTASAASEGAQEQVEA